MTHGFTRRFKKLYFYFPDHSKPMTQQEVKDAVWEWIDKHPELCRLNVEDRGHMWARVYAQVVILLQGEHPATLLDQINDDDLDRFFEDIGVPRDYVPMHNFLLANADQIFKEPPTMSNGQALAYVGLAMKRLGLHAELPRVQKTLLQLFDDLTEEEAIRQWNDSTITELEQECEQHGNIKEVE